MEMNFEKKTQQMEIDHIEEVLDMTRKDLQKLFQRNLELQQDFQQQQQDFQTTQQRIEKDISNLREDVKEMHRTLKMVHTDVLLNKQMYSLQIQNQIGKRSYATWDGILEHTE
jgi:uncharacterized membrane-anchored protein YhcB (DUF1043 family)